MMSMGITQGMAFLGFAVSTILILLSIYCTIIMGTTAIWSIVWVTIIPLVLDVIVFHGFFDYVSYLSGHGELRSFVGQIIGSLNNGTVLIVVIILCLSGFFRVRLIRRIVADTLTPFSVGEALDTLPMGIAFVGDSGIVLQSNDVMDDLSFVLTRKMLTNGNTFWDRICEGDVTEGYTVEKGEAPIAIGVNDFAWMFKRVRLKTKVGALNQLTAMDVSNEQSLLKELAANNERLEKMNDRLKRYSDIVDDAIRQEERLQTKIRIHDELGEALIATKMLIMNEKSPISEQEVLDRWNRDIALLRKENEEVEEETSYGTDQIERLRKAADHLGIELQLIGEMPENFNVVQLIGVGIQEAMTNAIQHANATQLYVVISDNADDILVSYSNNGKDVQGDIKEGGGLKLFRKSAEKMGAEVEYAQGPKFNMYLRIPKEVLMEGVV